MSRLALLPCVIACAAVPTLTAKARAQSACSSTAGSAESLGWAEICALSAQTATECPGELAERVRYTLLQLTERAPGQGEASCADLPDRYRGGQIDLSGSEASKLELAVLRHLPGVASIDLSRSDLVSLDGLRLPTSDSGQNDTVVHIDLSRNRLTDLPAYLLRVRGLSRLDVSHNDLESLNSLTNETGAAWPKLAYLDLSYNARFNTADPETRQLIANLPLVTIDLSYTSDIHPLDLRVLEGEPIQRSLVSLRLNGATCTSGRRLSGTFERLGHISARYSANFGVAFIDQIGRDLKVPRLAVLDLAEAQLSEDQARRLETTALQYLIVRGNQDLQRTDPLQGLSKLRGLAIGGSSIREVSGLAALSQLRSLDARSLSVTDRFPEVSYRFLDCAQDDENCTARNQAFPDTGEATMADVLCANRLAAGVCSVPSGYCEGGVTHMRDAGSQRITRTCCASGSIALSWTRTFSDRTAPVCIEHAAAEALY
jgi:Leucine-rich repeat (LRR) protein